MKTLQTELILVVTVSLGMLIVQGCGRDESYGEDMAGQEMTAIADILTDPGNYTGKTVTVAGKIATECPSGCWFEVADGGAIIYVDIAPAGLAIPQRVGKKVVVKGTVSSAENRTMVSGTGVKIH